MMYPIQEGTELDLNYLRKATDEHSIVAVTNVRGEIIYANKKFCEISKYSEAELLGKNHRIINSGYHPPEFFQDLWRTISSGKVWQGEVRNMAKDGTYYWMATTIVPVLNTAGVPYQYISIRTNITQFKHLQHKIEMANAQLEAKVATRTRELREMNEMLRDEIEDRKRAEYSLQQEARRTQLLYDLTTVANQAKNTKEGLQLFLEKILHFSDWMASHAYEFREGKLHPTDIWVMREGYDFPRLRAITSETVLKPGEGIVGRVYNRSGIDWISDLAQRSETITFVRCRATVEDGIRSVVAVPVVIQQEVTHVLEFFSKEPTPFNADTAKTLLQAGVQLGRSVERERTQKAQQLEQLNLLTKSKFAALGEMAAEIAHEINTPLSVVYRRAQQIRDLMRSGLSADAKSQEWAEQIVATSKRIGKIIGSLRNYARNNDQSPLTAGAIDGIIQETIDLCDQSLKKKGVRLDIEPVPSGLNVECRSHQISQVILNLLNNARDAVENMHEAWVRISVRDLGTEIAISVCDSGPNIPAEIEKRLFEPFFTTKTAGKGIGIGLSISQDIARAHGGRIEYDRETGQTRFTMFLPKIQANLLREAK